MNSVVKWCYVFRLILTNLFGHIVKTIYFLVIDWSEVFVILNGVFNMLVKWLDEHSVILTVNMFYWSWEEGDVGCTEEDSSYNTVQRIEIHFIEAI